MSSAGMLPLVCRPTWLHLTRLDTNGCLRLFTAVLLYDQCWDVLGRSSLVMVCMESASGGAVCR